MDAGKKRKYGFAANLSRSRTRYIPLICGATGKMRYFEADLKSERPVYGSNGEIKQVLPSREDSPDRLMEENARQFAAAAESVEDVVIRKLVVDKLHTALIQLTKEERISFVPCSLTRKQKAKWQKAWAFPSRPSTSGKPGYQKAENFLSK